MITIGPINDDDMRPNETGLEYAQRMLDKSERRRAKLIENKLAPTERKNLFTISIIVFAIGFILLWAIPYVWLSLICYFSAAGYFMITNIRLRKDNDFGNEIFYLDNRIILYKRAIKAHKETGIGV